ncbi:hypothetical protein XENTR_v10013825 [Xenopus tropicalis]|nr:hypothetical protein XENTR_v10013825 [Xenopus tropicalis]
MSKKRKATENECGSSRAPSPAKPERADPGKRNSASSQDWSIEITLTSRQHCITKPGLLAACRGCCVLLAGLYRN